MYIIPIQSETLDLIQELNGGMRPAAVDPDTTEPTFYVWFGPNEASVIISGVTLEGYVKHGTGIMCNLIFKP